MFFPDLFGRKRPPAPLSPDFLVADLAEPDRPGAGSAAAVQLIPPRENLPDPQRLAGLYTTLATSIARFSGQPVMAGGRAARKNTGTGGNRAGSPTSEFERELAQDPVWRQLVELDLVGTHREINFLLRSNNRRHLEAVVGRLSQAYPHLGVEWLKTGRTGDPATARGYDPFVLADGPACLTRTRYLVLAENPVMPLDSGGGRDRNSLDNNQLRQVLASLSRLEPGETLGSQLLVYGPAAREWVEGQRFRLKKEALREKQRDLEIRLRSSAAEAGNSLGNWLLLVLPLLLGAYLFASYIYDPFKRGLYLEMLPGLLGLILAVAGLAGLVIYRATRRAPDFTEETLEEKFRTPPLVAGLRLVASVPFEPYLREAGRQDEIFTGQGFLAGRAARLYRYRELLKSGKSPAALPLEPGDPALWEEVLVQAEEKAGARLEEMLGELSAGYSAYQSATGNAFTPLDPLEETGSVSALGPGSWPDPVDREPGRLRNLPPLKFFAGRELPPELRRYRFLNILNGVELSALWHLPGGAEVVEYLRRSGGKELGAEAGLLDTLAGEARLWGRRDWRSREFQEPGHGFLEEPF